MIIKGTKPEFPFTAPKTIEAEQLELFPKSRHGVEVGKEQGNASDGQISTFAIGEGTVAALRYAQAWASIMGETF